MPPTPSSPLTDFRRFGGGDGVPSQFLSQFFARTLAHGPAELPGDAAPAVERTGFTAAAAAANLKSNGETIQASEAVWSLTASVSGIAGSPGSWSIVAPALPVCWIGRWLGFQVGAGSPLLQRDSIQQTIAFVTSVLPSLPGSPADAAAAIVASEGRPALYESVVPPTTGDEAEARRPVGAGLVTQFLPFRLGSLDESVSRFLDGLGNDRMPERAEVGAWTYSVFVVSAGIALEASRRWRHQLAARRTIVDWKKGSRTLYGLS